MHIDQISDVNTRKLEIQTLNDWADNLVKLVADKGVSISLATSKNNVARIIGFTDWNCLINCEQNALSDNLIHGPEVEQLIIEHNIRRLRIMAKIIRRIFGELGLSIRWVKSLETLAHMMRFKNWNTLIAKAKSSWSLYLGPYPKKNTADKFTLQLNATIRPVR